MNGLGHLVTEFERLVLTLKVSIYTIMMLEGLKEVRYGHVLLADQTGYPILQTLRSLLSIRYGGRDLEFDHVDRLFALTSELIGQRNFMIHGSWFTDRAKSHPITAEILKYKTFKRCVDGEDKALSTVQMQVLIEKIRRRNPFSRLLTFAFMNPNVT